MVGVLLVTVAALALVGGYLSHRAAPTARATRMFILNAAFFAITVSVWSDIWSAR